MNNEPTFKGALIFWICTISIVGGLVWLTSDSPEETRRKAKFKAQIMRSLVQERNNCFSRGGYFVETTEGFQVCAYD